MDWPSICTAVAPCFNEAETIARVVSSVRAALPSVIVVDDGSTDGTALRARAARAEVLSLPRNCGKGAALRAGCHHAHSLGFTWALLLDGDGQHAASDIPRFLEKAERTRADLIIGKRDFADPQMPYVRRLANRAMSRAISRLCGCDLPDSQCGFRLVRISALRTLALRTEHFEIESEVLIGSVRAGLRIEFVPIQVADRRGASKIRPALDSCRWVRWFARECLHRALVRRAPNLSATTAEPNARAS